MAQFNQQVENFRLLLQQHWDHCRHLEGERSWFMNAYAAVIGAVSAFIIGMGAQDLATLEDSATFRFLIAFLIGFTFLGFFHTVRWTYAFECHRQRVNKLVGLMASGCALEIIWEDLNMTIPSMQLFPSPRNIWKSLQELRKFRQTVREAFRTRYVFPAIYFIALILFAIFFSGILRWWAIGCLGVALWLAIGFLRSRPE